MKDLLRAAILLLASFLILSAVPARAYTPAESYISRIAGGWPGFKDGSFYEARFNDPTDITFDATGKDLFVADMKNNRIRVIHTDQDNRVETLAGTGAAGNQDGPASTATFFSPSNIVHTQAGLIVYDCSDHEIRYIDLKTNVVSTLKNPLGNSVSRMIYCAETDTVYLTDPDQGTLFKLDMKTKLFSNVFKGNALIPHPKALCYSNGFIYVADASLPTVHRFKIGIEATPSDKNISFESGGEGQNIQAMTACNGKIYGLQSGTDPVREIYPNPQSVSIATAWGFYAQNNNNQAEPLIDLDETTYCGFTTSPLEPQKLYFCGGIGNSNHSIYNFKEYDYTHYWIGIEPRDFVYPAKKSPKTYRILVAGDSRVVTSPRVDPTDLVGGGTFLTDTYAKQLEFLLNTEAALENVDMHFEVLTLSRLDENCLIYGNYDMPDMAKKYDVDLILCLATCNYKPYYRSQITSEGIPAKDRDMELLLKPLKNRVPPGPAGDLYRISIKQHIGDKAIFFDNLFFNYLDHPDIRDCLMKMYDRPLSLLLKKLKAVKLANGSSPKLAITYVPWDREEEDPKMLEVFYKELCDKNDIPLVSIADDFNVLRASYYPTQQGCCDHHYTTYGNQLIARLLFRHLIQDKLVPFEPIK